MAQLSIKGHPTRGNEVIEILEMLGGKNERRFNGEINCLWHYINEYGDISIFIHAFDLNECIFFTLEEFLEKFPYKVGDKVVYKTYGIYSKIKTMLWNVEKEQVFYRLESNKLFVATADELKPYKEETMEEQKAIPPYMDYNVRTEETMEKIKIEIPAGYEFAGVDDNAQQVVFTKIQPQYPKTYEVCCRVLGKTNSFCFEGISLDEVERIKPFIKLLRCRDAYLKIAGEQMGLDKPWEPDYNEESYEQGSPIKYVIYYTGTYITKGQKCTPSYILAFPSEEMRDAFYENFKKLIEECKELL